MFSQKPHPKKEKEKDTVEQALQSAENILNYRDCSEKKLYQKLQLRGYSPAVCAEVVQKMVESGCLNEERQIEALCHFYAVRRLEGQRKITLTLRQQGYREEALLSIDWDAYDFVSLCEKRIRASYPRITNKEYQKVYAAMARHGFLPPQIKEALEHVLEEA